MKNLSFNLLFLFLAITPTYARITGADLNRIFSSSCSSQGPFTQRALADTEALISVIEGVKDDKNCTTVASSISSLRSVQETIASIENTKELNKDLDRLMAEENEITNILLNTNDPVVQAELEYLLRNIQISKAQKKSEIEGPFGLRNNREADLYLYLVESSEAIINTVSANSKCIKKYPQVLSAITSLSSGISAITYSYNPAMAIGFTAINNIFGNTVEYFRNRPHIRLINRVSKATSDLEGYKCALESLSHTWCINDEAEKVVELKANLIGNRSAEVSDIEISSTDRAITLSDKEIPIFLNWLQAVRAGATPSSSSEAQRQSEVLFREATVESSERTGLGTIQEEEPRYNNAPNDGKFNALKLVVLKLTNKSCGQSFRQSDGNNPLTEVFGGDTSRASYFLLGIDDDVVDSNNNIIDFCFFRPAQKPGYTPDYQILKSRYTEWIDRARAIVADERTRIIQPDPLSVITLSYDPSGNEFGLAPLDAAIKIYNFLTQNLEEEILEENRGFRLIYNDTKERLASIIEIIEESILMDDPSAMSQALIDISKLARLDNGIVLFQNRLEMIIRNSIQTYYRNQIGSRDSVALQLLAANSFLDNLKFIKGTDNLALILSDIKSAKRITLSNMSGLLEVFGKNIKDVLKDNKKEIDSTSDREIKEVYQRNTAHFCLLLASMPSWPEHIPVSYCLNTSLPPVIAGGPSSPRITYDFLRESFSKRSCGFRKYIQKSKVFQKWGVNIP